ncbi:MAG: hypothetical protein MUC88_25605, partial [Planctomycetes bacterium]|nr:hypothetical protein [Planctomycetota bacterium]
MKQNGLPFLMINLACWVAGVNAVSAETWRVRQNDVAECRMRSSIAYADPFREVTLDALVTLG